MSAIQKKFSNTFNHHQIFNDFDNLSAKEPLDHHTSIRSNVLNEKVGNSQKSRNLNPTFASQIFKPDRKEFEDFRKIKGVQAQKNMTAVELFGVHGNMDKTHCRGRSTNHSQQITKHNQKDIRSSCQKEKPLSFNQMWWDSAVVPNNDMSLLTANFARDRKHEDISSKGVDEHQNLIVLENNQKQKEKVGQDINGPFNIISNEQLKLNTEIEKNIAENQNQLKKYEVKQMKLRESNRNFSNLFGQCQEFSSEKQITFGKHKANRDKELFLPTNQNIDSYDSQIFNYKFEEGNANLNACDRHFKNLQSSFDTHSKQKEDVETTKLRTGFVDENLLDKLHKSFDISLIKKNFVRVADSEEVHQIQLKNLKNNFNIREFNQFCILKGYTLVFFQTNQNGKGSVYLKKIHKHAEPINAIVINLKINGANISSMQLITGKSFNSKNFESPTINKLPPRQIICKKQFPLQQCNKSQELFFSSIFL